MSGLFRWAGGKGRIADALFAQMATRAFCPPCSKLHDTRFNRWIEPFVGGGAMALEALRRGLAHKYVLTDASADVMSVYEALHDRFVELWLLDRLRDFAALPETEQRAQLLDQRPAYAPQFPGQQARRLLILQACGFNGLYRVNKSGAYNVPFGRCATFDFELLAEAAKLLREHEVKLLTQDFEQTIALADPGDIVYADLPYLGTHSAYTSKGFDATEHQRLAQCLRDAASRGAACWVSGSDCDKTRAVYGGVAHVIQVPRSMSCKGSTRGTKTELLIRVGG